MRRLLAAAIVTLIACAQTAHADTLFAYDGFNYTNNQTISNATSLGGDSGWAAGSKWVESTGTQAAGVKASNTNLPAVGNLTTSGLSLRVAGTDDPQVWRDLSQGYNAASLATASDLLWISFVLRKDATGVATDYAAAYLGKMAVGVASNGKYSLEDKNTSPTGPATSAVSATVGESVLLLVSIDFDTGVNGTNDTVRLYMATTASPTPTPIATKNNFDVGTISNVGLLFGYSAGWTFDEFRMSDSGFMAAPTPEPSALALPVIAFAALLRRRRA